jgi:hypothetical protein
MVKGDSVDENHPLTSEVKWWPLSSKYSGIIFVPPKGRSWELEIYVYDSMEHLIGFTSIDFNNLAGDIAVPVFDAHNAIPEVVLTAFTEAEIGDTVAVVAEVFNQSGSRITGYHWTAKDSSSLLIPICNQVSTNIFSCHGGVSWQGRFVFPMTKC